MTTTIQSPAEAIAIALRLRTLEGQIGPAPAYTAIRDVGPCCSPGQLAILTGYHMRAEALTSDAHGRQDATAARPSRRLTR